jgi:sugar lactone lactonase YvrE
MALSLVVGLQACTPPVNTTQTPQEETDPRAASFLGSVRIPNELLSNNGAGLISNNAGGLISNNAGGLISNSGSNYRVSALDEKPFISALVYLLNPDEQFYLNPEGQRIVATTDQDGAYKLDGVLPARKQVIVSAMLTGNRRLVGYTYTQKGENKVDVSVATTYVTEFFRDQAAKAGTTMGAYTNALAKLPKLVEETQKLLDDGILPIPDLTLGKAAEMNQAYLAVFGSHSQALSDGWADLLGRRVISLSTAAGTYAIGTLQEDGRATAIGLHRPTGVAADQHGNLFIAEKNQHGLRWVKPDGSSTFIGKFRGDGSIWTPSLSVDGSTFAETYLPAPHDVAVDHEGNLIVALHGQVTDTEVLVFLCRKAGTYFGKAMQEGHSYILGDPAGVAGFNHDDPDVHVSEAKFNAVTGVTFDADGNVYLADRRNNLVRRIARSNGKVEVVAGTVSFGEDDNEVLVSMISPEQAQTYATAEQNAVGAVVPRPYDVAIRRDAQGNDHLYIWEGYPLDDQTLGNAIREVVFNPATPTAGTIRFLVGPGMRGATGDGGPAQNAQINLDDPARNEVPNGGLAVSRDGRYLYFNDTHNGRLRVIDLTSNRIDTAAGGGAQEGNAEAKEASVKDLSGLATGPNGEVYFCDTVNHVVRKLNHQFGH